MKLSILQKFRLSEIRKDKWRSSIGDMTEREMSWLKIREFVYFLIRTIKLIVLLPVSTVRYLKSFILLLDEFERLHFSPLRKIHCGMDCVIDRQTWLANGHNIQLGDFVKISAFSSIIAGNVSTIKIGTNTIIGPGVTIVSINHGHELNGVPIRYQAWEDTEDSSIVIGDDVWLGANVVVLPGVAIGDGSVIGAGLVVKGAVMPGTVMYGRVKVEKKGREKNAING
ncbi:MAG: acyltransferase [Desulfobacterium sp.]|nr:acyltransferase [Desulfobacteraceae bacterium]MBA3035688.1 acyltransferase [Desulfobacterium sp.]MBU3948106.1 acyltransferase [Pseudomonadota bacterium]